MNSLFGICVSVLLAIGTALPSNHPQYGYPDELASSSAVVQQKHNWDSDPVYPTHHAEVQQSDEWNSAPVYPSHEAYPVEVQQKHNWNLAPHSYSTHHEYARSSSQAQQKHDWNPAPHSYATHPEYLRSSAHVQQKHTLNTAPQSYPLRHEYPGYQLHQIPGSAHMPSYTVPEEHYPSQPYPVHNSQAVASANSGPTPFYTTPNDMPRAKTVYIPMAVSGAEYSMPVADHDTRNVKIIHNTRDEIVQKAAMARIRPAEIYDDDDLQKDLITFKPKEVRTSELKEVGKSKPKMDGTSKPNSKDTIPCPKHHYQALPVDVAPIPVSLIKRIVSARKTKAEAVVATSRGKVLANVASSTTKTTGKLRPHNKELVELLLDHELLAKENKNNSQALHHGATIQDEKDNTEVDVTKTTENEDVIKSEVIIHMANKTLPIDHYNQNDNTGNCTHNDLDVTSAPHHKASSPDEIEMTEVNETKTTEKKDVTKTGITIDKVNKTIPIDDYDQDDHGMSNDSHDKTTPEDNNDNTGDSNHYDRDVTRAPHLKNTLPDKIEDTLADETNTREKKDATKTKVIIDSVNKNVPIDDYDQNDYDKSLEGKNYNKDDSYNTDRDVTRATHHETTLPDNIENTKVDVTKTTEEEDVTKTEVLINKANKNVPKYFDQYDSNVKKAQHNKNNPQNTVYTLRETEEDSTETKTEEHKDETRAIIVEGKQNDFDDYDQENHEAPFHKTPSQHDKKNDNDNHDDIDVTKTRSEEKIVSKATEKKDVTKTELIIDEAKENEHKDNYDQSTTNPTTDLDNEKPYIDATKPKYDQTKPTDVAITIASVEVEQILQETKEDTPLTPIGFFFSLISNVLKGRDNVRQMFDEPKVKSFVRNVIPLFPNVNDDKRIMNRS